MSERPLLEGLMGEKKAPTPKEEGRETFEVETKVKGSHEKPFSEG